MPKTDRVKQITFRPRTPEARAAIIEVAGDDITKFMYKCMMIAEPERLRPVLMKDLGVPEEVI